MRTVRDWKRLGAEAAAADEQGWREHQDGILKTSDLRVSLMRGFAGDLSSPIVCDDVDAALDALVEGFARGHIREDVAEGPGMSAVDAARLDDIGPDMLTPVQGGHVFAGTWTAFVECEDAYCAACGAAIKINQSVIRYVGSGADAEENLCVGWGKDSASGALMRVARAISREGDNGEPNGEAEDRYVRALDAFPKATEDGGLPTLEAWEAASKAMERWIGAYADEVRALRLAAEAEDEADEVGELRAEVARLRAEVDALRGRPVERAKLGYVAGMREEEHRPLAKVGDVFVCQLAFLDGARCVVDSIGGDRAWMRSIDEPGDPLFEVGERSLFNHAEWLQESEARNCPAVSGLNFTCSRPAGHDDAEHVALTVDDVIVDRWNDTREPGDSAPIPGTSLSWNGMDGDS